MPEPDDEHRDAEHQVDSGEFANITPLLCGDVQAADADFERGLRWLLDGIEREYS